MRSEICTIPVVGGISYTRRGVTASTLRHSIANRHIIIGLIKRPFMCTKRESCFGIRLRRGVYREVIGTCFYLRLNGLFIRAVRDILPYRLRYRINSFINAFCCSPVSPLCRMGFIDVLVVRASLT